MRKRQQQVWIAGCSNWIQTCCCCSCSRIRTVSNIMLFCSLLSSSSRCLTSSATWPGPAGTAAATCPPR